MAKYFMSDTRWSSWERMMMDTSRRPEPPRPNKRSRSSRRKPDRPHQLYTAPQVPSREVSV